MTTLRTALMATTFTLVGAAALAQGHGQHGAMSHAATPADTASTRDFKAADSAMMTAMAVPYTGNPDIDFRTHMIPHHQGAVDMARVALAHATAPATKTMAEGIIRDQEREIGEMKAWLARHGGK